MVTRIVSSVVGIPLLLFFLIMGGIPLKIGIIGVSLIGMHELYYAVSKNNKPIHIFGYAAAVFYVLSLGENYEKCDVILLGFFIAAMSFMVIMHKKINVIDILITVFGVLYIPVMFGFVYLIRENMHYGEYIVYLPFISAFGCDTGAYFCGLKLGKKKLIPDLSPKKTVEGAVGGTVSATVLAAIFGLIAAKCIEYYMSMRIGKSPFGDNAVFYICAFAEIGFVGSIFAQFGDLTASAIKRYAGVKDYGKIMPGHGGILDRFDSVIFTSGVVYIIGSILF